MCTKTHFEYIILVTLENVLHNMLISCAVIYLLESYFRILLIEVLNMISKLCDLLFYVIMCVIVGTIIFDVVCKLVSDDVVKYESWSRRECVFIEVNGVKMSCKEMPEVDTWDHVWVE